MQVLRPGDPHLQTTSLDSFISASARDPFTSRIVVDTGDEWGENANARRIRWIESNPKCGGAAITGISLSRLRSTGPTSARHERRKTLAYRRDRRTTCGPTNKPLSTT